DDATPIDGPSPTRAEHAAFQLVDNRHAAHRVVDGESVIDAGDIGFARYTRFGVPELRWKLGQVVDGERAAVADRLASIEVPLAAAQVTLARQVALRVHGAAGMALTLKVNGRKASATSTSTVKLADGWQSIVVPVDAGRFAVGENQIAFETTGARGDARVALAWLRIGAASGVSAAELTSLGSATLTTLLPDPREAATFDPRRDAIELAADASLVWYATVPEGANLVADVSAGCRVEVVARASDDSFAGGALAGGGARVDLSAAGGKVVGLVLTARDCPRATLVHPRITLHGEEEAPTPIVPPKYVVLWIMDATRADRIPLFSPGARALTPTFDELAKTGVVFRQYYTQGNESQTSHATLWTGVYPAVHAVRLAGTGGTWQVDKRFALIATELHDAGFATTAVTGNGFVTLDGGYARGFDQYRNLMREPGANGIIAAQTIADVAMAQLDARRAGPAYLLLGTIDNHFPWIAHKPWIDTYSPPPYAGKFVDIPDPADLGIRPDSMGCAVIPPPDEVERIRAIYDSDISYQDQQVGRLVAKLKSWGIWDQTLLVITADHGEELFEETRCGHGGSLRDTLVRVPLLMHYPAGLAGGSIVEEGVEEVDVLPTIVELVGRPAPPLVQGRSLVAQARGVGKGWATPSYASMYEYAHAMRIGRWKMRVGVNGTPMVEDMVDDPRETRDASPTRPVERRMLTDNLSMFLALRTQWRKAPWGTTSNVSTGGAAALDVVAVP
ncbi:MAG: sulfatase, partial [Proteobacteria bacterium]|nr:sulfatase [Pseudomonadota bacterium]